MCQLAVEVAFAAGFAIGAEEERNGDGLAEEAVELAQHADVTLLFLGLPASDESEGFDRTHMNLPSDQVALLRRVAEVTEKVVVVLANGSAVLTAPWQDDAGAILECWLGGQAAGGAVVDLLLGIANPSGRLAETIPVRLEDNSSFLNFPGDSGHVRYGEGLFVGYRGYDRLEQQVSFPFGHGLSYTSFAYSQMTVDVMGSHADRTLAVNVTCDVTNTGARAGKETVQLYVTDVHATVARPVRELRAFTKLDLAPGQSRSATFELTARDLSYWSETMHDWVLEAGEFEFAVGSSSRDLELRSTVYVDAPRVTPPLDPMSSLDEWLADPLGAAALRAALGTRPDGRLKGMLGDEEVVKVIGSFPMRSLAGFPNVSIDHATLDSMIEQMSPEMSPCVSTTVRWPTATRRLELALAHALVKRVSSGELGDVLRVYRPTAPVTVFGRRDTRLPGFAAAVDWSRSAGFEPLVRATGGRAVAYTGSALVVDHAVHDVNAVAGQDYRFERFGQMFADVFRRLGIDARVGAVHGEYCPGAQSVNARGLVKLVGTAQRVIQERVALQLPDRRRRRGPSSSRAGQGLRAPRSTV